MEEDKENLPASPPPQVPTQEFYHPPSPEGLKASHPFPIPHEPHPHHHMFLRTAVLIVLLVLITGLLTAGATYFILKARMGNKTPAPTPTPVIQEPTPTPEPITGWKTFDSPNRPYTFSYPKNWDVLANDNSGATIVAPKEVIDVLKKSVLNEGSTFLTLEMYEYNEPISRTTDENRLVTVKNIVLGGIPAKRYTEVYNQAIPGIEKGAILTSTVVQHKGKTYDLTLLKNEYLEIYNQILSTFKFTDSDSSNWKTYRHFSDKFGFGDEYQMPGDWQEAEWEGEGPAYHPFHFVYSNTCGGRIYV
ncbi:MAG: hypothetical protein HY426_00320, partial [Candidatus Levybacteria bacterium]|nr:hypothetical protein [Candidatus Levybacteria bacterium]